MSYEINYLGGTITLPLNQANTTATSLTLIGRNWTSSNVLQGFGQALNQNFVSMLENFANPTAPANPITGQLWYNSSLSTISLNTGTTASPVWQQINTSGSVISMIANNTSNVSIPVADGNVNTSINGAANVFVVSSTGANVAGAMTATGAVTGNTLASTAANGTQPLSVVSKTLVTNLNAEFANGYTAIFADTPSTIVVRDLSGAIVGNTIRANTSLSAPTGNITTINSATINSTTLAGALTTASQPNITSIGTLSSLTSTGLVIAPTFQGNLTGNATTAGTVITAAQPNITSTGSLTSLTSIGTVNFAGASNVSLGQVANVKIIGGTNGAFLVTNGTGGLSWSTSTASIVVGSVTTPVLTTGATANAGTITGQWSLSAGSTLTATYADLAEYYTIDRAAPPGTVVEFGGDCEITASMTDMSQRVAGVISTAPAFTMNDDERAVGKLREAVALQGRVPCRVVGITRKGDMMVSAGNGAARSEHSPLMGSVIGKALEDKLTEEPGTIEVAVGRL